MPLSGFSLTIAGEDLYVLELPQCALDDRLSRAEQEVVSFVLEGMSNEQIATCRGCSPKTVSNQLRSVYRKLGLSGRSELAALLR